MTKIKLDHICKIEGHASLSVQIDKGKLTKCNLMAFEGARFFEGIVKGRRYDEIAEITSRICGICSVTHNMSSLKATERAFHIKVSEQTDALRELMAIGERIRSHATHLYFLALPDYLGYESALAMAPKYRTEIERAMSLIKLGNEIVEKVGGRQMHPITCMPGGFTCVPRQEDVNYLARYLEKSKEDAMQTLSLFLKLKYPDLTTNTEHISLGGFTDIPLNEGSIVSDKGLNIRQEEYEYYFSEYLEPYATSKFAVKQGKAYRVGALSRINNNYGLLLPETRRMVEQSKIRFPSSNPFHNNPAQAIELCHWLEKGLRLLKERPFKPEDIIEPKVMLGRGIACTEAPRGMLFHDYEYNSDGYVTRANIMTPTCQNLAMLEQDITKYVQQLLDKRIGQNKIILEIEKLIRSYDPCFSCSTHFLKVDWKERK